MERNFSTYLDKWKERKFRKPLIVRGARQVGKTFLIEKWGKDKFKNFVKINLEETPALKSFFDTNDVTDIIQNIEIFFQCKVEPNTTLLFFDEIQVCPQAIQTLRYFYEKVPELHVICAGSLLDHLLNNMKESMPVGRVEFAYMHPMNFSEFLLAIGKEQLVSFLNQLTSDTKINETIHQQLLTLVRLYYFVGGMPEAVKVYKESGHLSDVEIVHESILKSLEYDFSKYNQNIQQLLLVKILRYIPGAVGQKLKYSHIDATLRSSVIKMALNLLKMSRIIYLVQSSNASLPPLEYGVNEKSFKPLFLDIGLMNHILKVRLLNIEDLETANEGSLAEQFIGQQLLSTPPYHLDSQLYYWNREKRNSEAELDYLIMQKNEIIPIEIKAGKTGTLRSLHLYMASKNKKIAIRYNTDVYSKVKVHTKINILSKVQDVDYTLFNFPLYLNIRADLLIP